jgi:hypothetical protein
MLCKPKVSVNAITDVPATIVVMLKAHLGDHQNHDERSRTLLRYRPAADPSMRYSGAQQLWWRRSASDHLIPRGQSTARRTEPSDDAAPGGGQNCNDQEQDAIGEQHQRGEILGNQSGMRLPKVCIRAW